MYDQTDLDEILSELQYQTSLIDDMNSDIHTIKLQQIEQISGDNYRTRQNITTINILAIIELAVVLVIIYRVIERMLKT